MIVTTDIDVLICSKTLFKQMYGHKNTKGTAELRPQMDPDGVYIISKQILTDPDWSQFLKGKKLPVKKYKYDDGSL